MKNNLATIQNGGKNDALQISGARGRRCWQNSINHSGEEPDPLFPAVVDSDVAVPESFR